MYAIYKPADPRVIAKPKNVPLQVDLFGVVDGKGFVDNGLGFGQGSTAGVIQPKQQCSGFQRLPRLQNNDCEARKQFNLHRLCSSPYACHFDPIPCQTRK